MDGPIKIYGLIVLVVFVIMIGLGINKIIISEDEMFNMTRTSQIQVINDAVNIGDLIVNNKISINKAYVEKTWATYFEKNIDTTNKYEIKHLKVIDYPPLIGVKLTFKDHKTRSYSNVIILEEGE